MEALLIAARESAELAVKAKLFQLSWIGDVATLREMLDTHPEAVHLCDEVHQAITVSKYFSLVSPYSLFQEGRTLLHRRAAQGLGRKEVMALLLDRGAKVDATDKVRQCWATYDGQGCCGPMIIVVQSVSLLPWGNNASRLVSCSGWEDAYGCLSRRGYEGGVGEVVHGC